MPRLPTAGLDFSASLEMTEGRCGGMTLGRCDGMTLGRGRELFRLVIYLDEGG